MINPHIKESQNSELPLLYYYFHFPSLNIFPPYLSCDMSWNVMQSSCLCMYYFEQKVGRSQVKRGNNYHDVTISIAPQNLLCSCSHALFNFILTAIIRGKYYYYSADER